MSDYVDYSKLFSASDVHTFSEITQPAQTVVIGGVISVKPDGTIECLAKLDPKEFDIAVTNAGQYAGLLRAIWIAGKCGAK